MMLASVALARRSTAEVADVARSLVGKPDSLASTSGSQIYDHIAIGGLAAAALVALSAAAWYARRPRSLQAGRPSAGQRHSAVGLGGVGARL